MNLRFYFLTILLLQISSLVFSSEIVIEPGNTGDDSELIQSALDGLKNGDTLQLKGNFTLKKTIYLPSNFTWILVGSITLAGDADLDEAGWVDSQIDASRRTGITEKTGGATNIDMSGGTYYGNSANYPKSMRYLNFVSVTNSKFHDMLITEVTDDNFTLGPGCNNNECNKLIGSFAKGGNAMTDKGDHNTWIDCVASDCGSDGWTPKCRYSTFIRCIAANNMGPGFGMYAREEGYANNKDVGAHIIGNKFFDCVSYGSAHSSGFSFNISSNCPGAIIKDNYIQAVCYNNQGSGVYFRNKDDAELGIIKDNEVDIVCYGNKGLSKSGNNNSWAGGLGMENDNSSSHNLIETITGSVVCYDNKIDVNTKGGHNCNITAYHPETEANLVLNDKSSYNNTVTVTDFTCSDSLKTWGQQKYCQDMAVGINRIQLPSSNSQFHIYPNPVELNASIEYNVPDAGLVSLKIYDLMGKELVSLVNEKKQKGLYKTEFWKGFPDLSASKIIDFLKLAKNGKPLEIVHPPEGVDKRTFDIQLQQSELLKSFTYLRNNCNAGLKS